MCRSLALAIVSLVELLLSRGAATSLEHLLHGRLGPVGREREEALLP